MSIECSESQRNGIRLLEEGVTRSPKVVSGERPGSGYIGAGIVIETRHRQAETRARGVSMLNQTERGSWRGTRAGMQQRACDINGQGIGTQGCSFALTMDCSQNDAPLGTT